MVDEIENEEVNDEDATLADDLLDEVSSGSDSSDDLLEGFGVLPETTTDEKDGGNEGNEDEETETLEEDAEDVDYDRFDDIDEY